MYEPGKRLDSATWGVMGDLADRIVVLEHGRVVQHGAAHTVRDAACGPYYELEHTF
jgi:ABC-type glutathione transport system ATPase component